MGSFFFGNGFVPVEIVELDFGSWGEQKSVFSSLKRSAANFGNWPALVSDAVFTRKGGRISV